MKTGNSPIITTLNNLSSNSEYNGRIIVVLGQPRSGKTTVAKQLSEKLSLPILHTDRLRADMRLHCPWCGFDTEIEPHREEDFINRLLFTISDMGGGIIEGSSIAPRMLPYIIPDAAVMMYRDISPKELLSNCRTWDGPNCWTYKKADTYLLRLFADYRKYAQKWAREVPNLVIETHPDFENGISKAIHFVIRQLKQ